MLRHRGGNVIAEDVRSDVGLKTSGGDVVAKAIDGAISARTSGGGVTAELLGQNRGISASSSGGSIVLHLPKNIAATLDASSNGVSISSDLPVSTHEEGRGKLSGAINGGGPTIKLHTAAGRIKLVTGE
ncbi:MAG TPA: DUF4097 family beta strand repeat-containing protein [Steroidobacter sp.]|jgi:DUF4097 and DUF4098 domain-containing protein YvlB|nr:DUF4097 family beta strand repeat-containing protein [Steroidobacter sp.]